jgi:copper chaperone NosL
MKTKGIKLSTKILLVLGGLALLAVLFLPIWRIELSAPQYPEGLSLQIFANRLGGNVDIINGLNHYIGMRTLHREDFIELSILPWCIIFFAALFILAAILNKRKWLNTVLILFICFGIIAMADFWRWEYDYGHKLNPDAAIKVPGMAYQPPLIGYKQLLNFGAYSIPDNGGWIFIGAGLLLVLCVVLEWKYNKKSKLLVAKAVPALLLVFFLQSCSTAPSPIRPGVDNCYYCKMTVSDARFGAELITEKGKIYKFDDMHCILSFIKSNAVNRYDINAVYLTDFSNQHQLHKADESFLLQSDKLRSPMNGNIAAFHNEDSMKKALADFKGTGTVWSQLIK